MIHKCGRQGNRSEAASAMRQGRSLGFVAGRAAAGSAPPWGRAVRRRVRRSEPFGRAGARVRVRSVRCENPFIFVVFVKGKRVSGYGK